MLPSIRIIVIFMLVCLVLLGFMYAQHMSNKAEVAALVAEREILLTKYNQQQDLVQIQNAAIDELKKSADVRQKAAEKQIANAKSATDAASKRADKFYSARSRDDNCSDALSIVNGRW